MVSEASRISHALDLEKAGDWDAAHQIVQQIESFDSYRVHAYLHRKEGDLANAQYWYRRAEQKMPDCSLDQEWQNLAAYLHSKSP